MFSCFSILQDSMATTYEDEGPIPWFRTEQCIFYIVFFVVFPFFFVNIFVALIIVTFNELGEAELEDDMDKNQKSCIDFAIRARFFSHKYKIRARFFLQIKNPNKVFFTNIKSKQGFFTNIKSEKGFFYIN